jgi:hypothetical protein
MFRIVLERERERSLNSEYLMHAMASVKALPTVVAQLSSSGHAWSLAGMN